MSDYQTTPGIRSTNLKKLATSSPAHYRWAVDNPDAGDTPSRQVLRAIHCAVLEPETFAREYATYSGQRRGKAWAAWQEANPGATGLTTRAHTQCVDIATAVREHPVAGPVLDTGTHFEHAITWVDNETGLPCKAQLDEVIVGPDVVTIPDLKTVGSCDLDDMEKMAWRMGWHIQFAHYAAAAASKWPGRRIECAIIAVEDKAPHDCTVLYISPELMEAGETKRRELLDTIAECTASGVWPGRYSTTQEMGPPHWFSPDIIDSRET